MPDRLARALPWAVPLGGLLLFAALWLPHRGFWLDDAFITFRYARNLADGVGPVFNPGEHVEGYTNFAWMLLSAAAFAALSEGAALVAIKAAGLALGTFVLWRCFTFPSLSGAAGKATPSRPHVRLAVLLLAAHPVFVANCGDGLETPLFMAWGIESARALVRAPTPRSGALLGVLTAGAVWTRPEALPLLVVWPVLVAACRRPRRLAGWHAGFALASLPLVLGQLAWRWAYYGQPFPNTFVAKATGALLPRLEAGLRDVAAFAGVGVGFPPLATWLAGGLAIFGTLVLLRGPARGTGDEAADVRTGLAGLWTLVGFRLAFDVWSGSEFMGTYRFLAPALPPLFVLADEGLAHVPARARRGVAVAGALAMAAAFAGNARLVEVRGRYERGLEAAHVAVGRWLRESQPPDTLVAVGDAGAIPFFSRLPVIDLWGLSDAAIAGLPGEYGDRPGTAAYALSRHPGVIVLWNLEPIRRGHGPLRLSPAQPFDREIAAHPDFRRDYRFAREFTFRERTHPAPEAGASPDGALRPDGYYLDVFTYRPDGATRRGE